MKTVAIIQARVGSTRLPCKVLMKILGKTKIDLMVERVRHSKVLDEIVVATTTEKKDDAIGAECKKIGVRCFRGSENDVLDRYYQCAKKEKAGTVVRLTADCPLIDAGVIDTVVTEYKKGSYDYVTNAIKFTWPDGFDVEVFSFDLLERAWSECRDAKEREHSLTAFVRRQPRLFKIKNVEGPRNYTHMRLTLDYIEDFEVIKAVFEALYTKNNKFTIDDIAEFMKENPGINSINAKWNSVGKIVFT